MLLKTGGRRTAASCYNPELRSLERGHGVAPRRSCRATTSRSSQRRPNSAPPVGASRSRISAISSGSAATVCSSPSRWVSPSEPVNRIRPVSGLATRTGLPSPQVRESANQSREHRRRVGGGHDLLAHGVVALIEGCFRQVQTRQQQPCANHMFERRTLAARAHGDERRDLLHRYVIELAGRKCETLDRRPSSRALGQEQRRNLERQPATFASRFRIDRALSAIRSVSET